MNSSNLTLIHSILDSLRQLTQQDIQSLWRYTSDENLNLSDLVNNFTTFPLVTLNDKGFAIWEKGKQVQWFIQKITLPSQLQKYPLEGLILRLKLTWWAENAKLYINGDLRQEGDLFDSTTRLLLTSSVIPGQEIWIILRLVSPCHDIGGLMQSQLIFEKPDNLLPEPSFVADELTILCQYLEVFNPSALEIVITELQRLEWERVSDRDIFDIRLNQLRNRLKSLTASITSFNFNLLGHAHLDMAWLWPLSETWEAAQRTFTSVLQLQQDFSSLIFGHTSPILYEWIEKNRPDLFKSILEAYNAGKWELLGGMWVEPDTHLVSGESLIRQLLYGQLYFQDKFGTIAKVAWLTDTFGFTWQLPQILRQSGIEYFVTGKLHWNDTTTFPYGYFKWRSPDGTELPTLMSPPNVAGVMDTNPLVMTDYALKWYKQTDLSEVFWLPGVGDHGGGPTRDMLQVQKRWQNSHFFPSIQFSTAYNYLEKVTQKSSNLPIWEDELYLEFHRGCYTTHAEQKLYNRRSEELLYQAELWSSIAHILNQYTYPKVTLETLWKKVLLNQFHDILPGTSIPEVFQEANQEWQTVQQMGEDILQRALTAIASQIILPQFSQDEAIPLIIFNSLNWQRSEVVSVEIPQDSQDYLVYDYNGHELTGQITYDHQLLFYAENIPSIGYGLFWLCPVKSHQRDNPEDSQEFILENGLLRVKLNSDTGELESIFDVPQQREILRERGNQLQFFQDQGQYWDAWNIDPNYQQYPLPASQLISIQWLDKGVLQQRIRVIKQFQNSTITQDYILQIHSPLLKIATHIDWQETHILLKAAFPLNLKSDKVSYEIPCGTIERATEGKTEAEKAKWEVSALHWADLTDENENYGVSLINDSKYGYDSQPQQLRLSLLRGSQWPDPYADQGNHRFSYGVYPHVGSYQTAKTVQTGYEFNIPLQVLKIPPKLPLKCPNLSSKHSFISLPDNLILMAFKASEIEERGFILRCYESQGITLAFSFKSSLGLKIKQRVNLLEQPMDKNLRIKPWQIASFQVNASQN